MFCLLTPIELAVKTIKENLGIVGFSEQAQVLCGDALKLSAIQAAHLIRFHLRCAAPIQRFVDREPEAIDAQPEWLNPDGQAIAQIDPKEYEELALTHLVLVDQRKYGSTMLCFYERPGE